MNLLKKIGFRATLCVLGLLCAHSLSAYEVEMDGIRYYLDSDRKTAELKYVDQNLSSVVIPSMIEYEGDVYEVVVLDLYEVSFTGNENLESIVIELPLTAIPSHFFEGCKNLSFVMLPEGITTIGYYAFASCESLESLDFLPESIEEICDYAFSNCLGLKEIVWHKGIRYNSGVFEGCSNVESLTVEDVDSQAVSIGWGFPNLKRVYIADGDSPLEIGIPDDAPVEYMYIGRDVKMYFDNKSSLQEVVFSDGVTYVPESLFSEANALTTVNWGNNIKYIGGNAFRGANLTSVVLPESVDSLAEGAFAQNKALVNIELPSTLSYIGGGCFAGCAVTNFVFPAGVKIADGFDGCKSLSHVVIPDNVTAIAGHAFFDCRALEQVTIGRNVKEIGSAAFYECNKLYDVYYDGNLSDWCKIEFQAETYPEDTNPLRVARNFYVKNDGEYQTVTELIIPEDVEEIKPFAFHGCPAFTSVTIPDNVRRVGEDAFGYCMLKSIYVNADTIAEYAFLTTSRYVLTLGENVKVIEDYAFYNPWDSNTTVYEGDINGWLKIKKEGVNALSCGELTIGGVLLTDFSPQQFSVFEIPDFAFYGCTSLQTANLPYSVKTIGDRAFVNCVNLTEVSARGATRIGEAAFALCKNLVKADFVNNNTTRGDASPSINIGQMAFGGCSKLAEILLPENIGEIGPYAFDGTLWYENFPDGIVYFGEIAYSYKGNMPENTTLTVKSGTAKINDYAFENQANLRGIVIPNSVTAMGDYAFKGCGLKDFTLPSSVDTVSIGLLKNCSDLKAIRIPGSVAYISREVFSGCSALEEINVEDSETPLFFEGYYLYYHDDSDMYYPTSYGDYGFNSSSPKHLYLGRDMQMSEFLYDYGYGYGEQDLNKGLSILSVDSLQTLVVGKEVTILNLPTIPLYYEWVETDNEYGGYSRYYTTLTSVTCLGVTPPTFLVDEWGNVQDPFVHHYLEEYAKNFLKICVPLTVPEEAVEAYKVAAVWKDFHTIKGANLTAIKEPTADDSPNVPIYNMSGMRMNGTRATLPAGMYIQNGKKFIVM